MRDSAADTTGRLTCESLVVAVVEALATARDVDPLDLPPLHDYVDVDALSTLFRTPAGTDRGNGWVTFPVERHEVRVSDDGSVAVSPLDAGADDSATYN
ncbi:HalOD1 output domain-containing protein [Halomarina rubra]|uniref:HalOD1 output domain-containing protein n=1 Tax=Halomarina rubra TaxID=2071873 RepID=A0ABD6AWR2_9EURY|nr:HalOD1 output domain-containing protein [Halomarina rubra]